MIFKYVPVISFGKEEKTCLRISQHESKRQTLHESKEYGFLSINIYQVPNEMIQKQNKPELPKIKQNKKDFEEKLNMTSFMNSQSIFQILD